MDGDAFFKASHKAVYGKETGTLLHMPAAVLKEFSKKVLLIFLKLPTTVLWQSGCK